jgi:hypothetical protein
MLRADRMVEKLQIRSRDPIGSLDSAEGKRLMRKLENAIDRLPAFNKPHKW